MTIELITPKQHKRLLEIQRDCVNLTYFNTGYDCPDRSKWSANDKAMHLEVSDILKNHVKGFSEFNHFKKNANGDVVIRLQYNYSADDPNNDIHFTGVGYITVDELLNGFKQEQR